VEHEGLYIKQKPHSAVHNQNRQLQVSTGNGFKAGAVSETDITAGDTNNPDAESVSTTDNGCVFLCFVP
jgi:hypothetical protein